MSTDFIIFALPLPVLPTLRMPRRQKWMLAMVFSLGFLSVKPLVSLGKYLLLIQDMAQRLHSVHCPTNETASNGKSPISRLFLRQRRSCLLDLD